MAQPTGSAESKDHGVVTETQDDSFSWTPVGESTITLVPNHMSGTADTKTRRASTLSEVSLEGSVGFATVSLSGNSKSRWENGRDILGSDAAESLARVGSTIKPSRTLSRTRSNLELPRTALAASAGSAGLGDHESSFVRKSKVGSSTWANFKRSFFGIGPSRVGDPGSKVIHPDSPFAQTMNIVSMSWLLYVAIVTPVTIGMFWVETGCRELPTLKIDMAADCFFLFELVYNFYVGVTYQGRYRDELRVVAFSYLNGAFLFDVCTSIPVAIIEYVALQACDPDSTAVNDLRFVRATKPLKLFRVLRVLRTSKLLIVFDFLESKLRPPPFTTRVFRLLFVICMIVHASTCAFWFVKDNYSEPEEVAAFLEEHHDGKGPNDTIVNKYIIVGIPHDPSPCLDAWYAFVVFNSAHMISLKVSALCLKQRGTCWCMARWVTLSAWQALYFINSIFTTVGFGDIVATNGAEKLFCVLMMYLGTIVFGATLGEVQMAMSQVRKAERERSQLMLEAKHYLRDQHVPTVLARRLLSWIHFSEESRQRFELQQSIQGRFDVMMRRELADHLHQDRLLNLPIFRELRHPQRSDFLLDLFMAMESCTTCKELPIGQAGFPADGLYIVQHGTIKVTIGGDMSDPAVANLIAGDHFGEFALFEDTTWQTPFGRPASYWCETFVECLFLSRDKFKELVSSYDEKLESELFSLALSARAMRRKTSKIHRLPLLRWCQLMTKICSKIRGRARETSVAGRLQAVTGKLVQGKTHGVRKVFRGRPRKNSLFGTAASDDGSEPEEGPEGTEVSPCAASRIGFGATQQTSEHQQVLDRIDALQKILEGGLADMQSQFEGKFLVLESQVCDLAAQAAQRSAA